jgi:hypothetical protein
MNVTEKIQKLLALADSPNEHEATLAFQKAQELMAQYGVEVSLDLETDTAITEDVLESSGRMASFKKVLAAAVAQACYCMAVNRYSSGTQIRLIGKQHHIATAVHLYSYLVQTVERVAKVKVAEYKATHGGNMRSYSASFKVGMAYRLWDRLQEKTQSLKNEGIPEANVSALAVQDAFTQAQKDINDYLSGRSFRKSKTTVGNASGYSNGANAANSVNLDAQLTPGQKLLG